MGVRAWQRWCSVCRSIFACNSFFQDHGGKGCRAIKRTTLATRSDKHKRKLAALYENLRRRRTRPTTNDAETPSKNRKRYGAVRAVVHKVVPDTHAPERRWLIAAVMNCALRPTKENRKKLMETMSDAWCASTESDASAMLSDLSQLSIDGGKGKEEEGTEAPKILVRVPSPLEETPPTADIDSLLDENFSDVSVSDISGLFLDLLSEEEEEEEEEEDVLLLGGEDEPGDGGGIGDSWGLPRSP